jgi:hypothetical protein
MFYSHPLFSSSQFEINVISTSTLEHINCRVINKATQNVPATEGWSLIRHFGSSKRFGPSSAVSLFKSLYNFINEGAIIQLDEADWTRGDVSG